MGIEHFTAFGRRLLKLEGYLHIVSATLAAFVSFTFAAAYPYSLGVDRNAKVMPRAKSPKTYVETKQLNRVSAEVLKQAFQKLPPGRLKGYADLVERLDKNVRWTHHEDELRRSLGPSFSDEVPPPDPSESKAELSEKPEGASDGATAGEAWIGVYKILNNALSKLISVPEGTLGELAAWLRTPDRQADASLPTATGTGTNGLRVQLPEESVGSNVMFRLIFSLHARVRTSIVAIAVVAIPLARVA